MSGTEITSLDALAAGVMPDVEAEVAGVKWEVSTRALPTHGAPPRVVWVPGRDRWEGPQKTPRGGGASGRSLATCHAGVELHCWGADRPAAWALVRSIVRALRRRVGPEPFLRIEAGAWLSVTGAATLGEAYVLAVSVALDVPALPDPPATATPTGAALDATGAAAGDGNLDAGEAG